MQLPVLLSASWGLALEGVHILLHGKRFSSNLDKDPFADIASGEADHDDGHSDVEWCSNESIRKLFIPLQPREPTLKVTS